MLRQQNIDL